MNRIQFCMAMALAATSLAPLPAPAQQQPVCGNRSTILEQLAGRWGEAPVGRGLTPRGAVLEILAGPAGTWTVLVTVPGGPSCIVAAGEAWEILPLPAPGEGAGDPA